MFLPVNRVINGAVGAADAVGQTTDCRNLDNLRYQVRANGGGGSPAKGSFEIWMSDDNDAIRNDTRHDVCGPDSGTARWFKVNIPVGAVHGTGYTSFSSPQDHIDWDGTANLNIGIDLDDPFMYACLVFRASMGSGITGDIIATVGGRGVV